MKTNGILWFGLFIQHIDQLNFYRIKFKLKHVTLKCTHRKHGMEAVDLLRKEEKDGQNVKSATDSRNVKT